jgi:hypothetical protein
MQGMLEAPSPFAKTNIIGGRMTLRKRWRLIVAAMFQQWHQRTCGECGSRWMAVGPLHPELIHICDACELKELERFQAFAEREWHQQSKGVF